MDACAAETFPNRLAVVHCSRYPLQSLCCFLLLGRIARISRIARIAQMRPIATHVARSVISPCLCVCWKRGRVLHERMNRSGCLRGRLQSGPKEPGIRWAPDPPPTRKDTLEVKIKCVISREECRRGAHLPPWWETLQQMPYRHKSSDTDQLRCCWEGPYVWRRTGHASPTSVVYPPVGSRPNKYVSP